jgi:hypothetical protein
MPKVYGIDNLTDGQIRAHIAGVIAQATDAEVEDGKAWYSTAATFARGLSERYGIRYVQACGIVAALSPGTSWDRNLVLAETMVSTGDCKHAYGDAIRKARRILEGESCYSVLGGQKVLSFFDNIAMAEHSQSVTVDRHAYAIAMGVLHADDAETKGLQRKGVYTRVADAYRAVADELGLQPHQCQAIAWVVHRRLKGLV